MVTCFQYILLSGMFYVIFHIGLAGNLTEKDHQPSQTEDRQPKSIDDIRARIEAARARLLNKLNKFSEDGEPGATEAKFTRPVCSTDVISRILASKNDVVSDTDHLYDEIRKLVRLQRAHNLSVADMTDGCLLHTNTSTTGSALTAEDCSYIGLTCAEKHDHESAVDWLYGCENKFEEVNYDRAFNTLILSALFTGNKALATEVLQKVLDTDPSHRIFIDLDLKLTSEIGQWNENQTDQGLSLRMCADDYENDVVLSNDMKCRYNHHNSPFLIIAPLKEEILSLEPKISLFRDIVYDSEIELLKDDAYHKVIFVTGSDKKDLTAEIDYQFMHFFAAHVLRPNGTREIERRYRPTQVAFLFDFENIHTKLKNRLSDMVSLSQKFSEPIQMLHYAAGGFYRVHTDFITNCHVCNKTGNRLASALMYLNDVILGGNTVFPRMKLNIRPVKGSALYWLNMKVNDTEEEMTRHAACPVIYGEKYVATQWYRMKGQDHWIAEPDDDRSAKYSTDLNTMCLKRRVA